MRFATSRRRVGQESFGFAADGRGARSSLDDLAGLIDWAPVEGALSEISSAAKGSPPGFSRCGDLSDVKLAEALDDRASFRRVCGFSSSEPTPKRTAFVRVRDALVAREPDKALFDKITAPLKAKVIRVKTGTLIDATIIASASEGDEEARWVQDKGRPAVHGFKAHVGADAETALVEEIAVTPANVNEGKADPGALPDEPGEVFADSTYRGSPFKEAGRARGGVPRIVATEKWGRAQDRWCPIAILDTHRVNDQPDQQAERVGDDVSLAALDPLAGVEAPNPAAFGGFRALAVDDARVRAPPFVEKTVPRLFSDPPHPSRSHAAMTR